MKGSVIALLNIDQQLRAACLVEFLDRCRTLDEADRAFELAERAAEFIMVDTGTNHQETEMRIDITGAERAVLLDVGALAPGADKEGSHDKGGDLSSVTGGKDFDAESPPAPVAESAASLPEIMGAKQETAMLAASDLLTRRDGEIKRMAREGKTYEEISAAVGLSSGYVRVRAKELGMEPRASGPKPQNGPKRFPVAGPRDADGLSRTERQVLDAIKTAGKPCGLDDMPPIYGATCELSRSSIPNLFSDLVRRGILVRTGPGRYVIAPKKRPPSDKTADQSLIDAHISEHGVKTEPDFGDAEINSLYRQLRARGHSLVCGPNKTGKKFLLDGSSFPLSRVALVARAKAIIENEKPIADQRGGVA
jgi:hypothetical protein